MVGREAGNVIRHYCLSLSPAGQNALSHPVWHYRVRDGEGAQMGEREREDERGGYHWHISNKA